LPKAVELVDALKREMRARRITYKDLALKLELSEGAIKRMFALNRMTLDRVDQICDVLKVDLAELVENYMQDEQRLDQLSEAPGAATRTRSQTPAGRSVRTESLVV
jgi:DNA-binding Xre family transcriptional regulator